MGYTHYFHHTRRFTNAQWAEVMTDLNRIAATARAEGITLADGFGESELPAKGSESVTDGPRYLPDQRDESGEKFVSFNGLGEDGHETFILFQNRAPLLPHQDKARRGWDFCKTARKPYDVAVTACLCYLESVYPGQISAESDGAAEDWQDGLALARRALPEKGNMLRIPLAIEFEDQFSATHYGGGDLFLATLRDGRLCLADGKRLRVLGTFETEEAREWVKSWAERYARAQGPAEMKARDRWEARKFRTFAEAAESFGYLKRIPVEA